MVQALRSLARRAIPRRLRQWLSRKKAWPPLGTVRWGGLRRTAPISRDWGFDRGQPIDRHYIERFLSDHSTDIRGRVLEIDNNAYTRMFGGDRVTRSDVLHISEMKPGVTMVGDLARTDDLPADLFDCIVLTQTLQLTYDVAAVVRTLRKMLKPGGVALVTVPCISKMTRDEEGTWGYHWGFTSLSAKRLFGDTFSRETVRVTTYGNVLTSAAFLYGLATEELDPDELAFVDPEFELVVCVRAQKPA